MVQPRDNRLSKIDTRAGAWDAALGQRSPLQAAWDPPGGLLHAKGSWARVCRVKFWRQAMYYSVLEMEIGGKPRCTCRLFGPSCMFRR